MTNHPTQPLVNFESTDCIAVVGLGYTGLPLALELAVHFKVIGYDHDASRIESLQNGKDYNREVDPSIVKGRSIQFTASAPDIKTARLFIITVPTPVDESKKPDLNALSNAMQLVGGFLKRGDCVVLESTVYPGCTEEYCIPLLEKVSGLKVSVDFAVGYSPERINPGDRTHNLENVVKLVAASDKDTCQRLAAIYSTITRAGVYICPSIKVAEAAKLTENIQRDVNIALMNELSAVYQQLGLMPSEVWDAASTKWNFLPFRPGMAGGHCISVDPYYLLDRAAQQGVSSPLVSLSREINEGMVERIAVKLFSYLSSVDKLNRSASVLLMGISFKPDVVDTRNSKAIELALRFQEEGLSVDLFDPVVQNSLTKEGALRMIERPEKKYDCILMAVGHQMFKELGDDYFCNHLNPTGIMIDLTGHFQTLNHKVNYWSI